MDLSRTHDRFGALWIPKTPGSDPVPAAEDRSLDDLDLPRFKLELERRFSAASRTCDSSNLTSDQRQYAAGFKNGLREALTLLDVSRRPPAPNGGISHEDAQAQAQDGPASAARPQDSNSY